LPVAIPPALLLALLIALLGTQVAYLLAPRAPHYLVRLGISALAVLLGEGLGLLGVGSRFALGEVHPINDLVFLVALQWGAGRWLRRQPV
jgi:hypothetical protein